jgi:chromosome segregation ATPase
MYIPEHMRRQAIQEEELIKNYKTEIEQLKAALKESNKYADKLVANIPYLPADIENLRESNAELGEAFTQHKREIVKLREEVEYHREEVRRMREDLSISIREKAGLQGHIDSLSRDIYLKDNALAKFMKEIAELAHPTENPGPYTVEAAHSYFLIVDRNSDVIARSLYDHVALLLCGLLNLAYHSQSANIESYQKHTH